jgi:hypothetical protein
MLDFIDITLPNGFFAYNEKFFVGGDGMFHGDGNGRESFSGSHFIHKQYSSRYKMLWYNLSSGIKVTNELKVVEEFIVRICFEFFCIKYVLDFFI